MIFLAVDQRILKNLLPFGWLFMHFGRQQCECGGTSLGEYSRLLGVYFDINKTIYETFFNEKGINFPFPQTYSALRAIDLCYYSKKRESFTWVRLSRFI